MAFMEPINPRLLLLRHMINAGAPAGGAPHGFGPNGVVNGTPPVPANHIPLQPFSLGDLQGFQGQAQGDPLQGYVPGAPNLPAGTYTGAYAAQGLRTTDPGAAAQLWESRHPAQVQAGNVPGWVNQAMGGNLLDGMHAHFGNVAHAHDLAAQLAQHIVRSRGGGRQRSLRRITQLFTQGQPPTTSPPVAPSFTAN